jgi:hypothetical protein
MRHIKLHNLDEWTKVGKGVELLDAKHRKVRMMLNVDGVASVYWKQGRSKTFLGLAEGRTDIEFETEGIGTIQCEGATAWWRCTEVQHRQVAVAGESFTEPHMPRQRNYELELMMAKAQQNSDARMAEMEKMYARKFAELERRQLAEGESPAASDRPGEGADEASVPDGPDQGGEVSAPADQQETN